MLRGAEFWTFGYCMGDLILDGLGFHAFGI